MRVVAGIAALAIVLASVAAGAASAGAQAADVPPSQAGSRTPWTRLVAPAQGSSLVLAPAELAARGPPPTIQDGVGPGSALQMGVGGIDSVCTAAFLVRDPATARYYLSTAGHCLVRDPEDDAPVTGLSHPDKTLDRVDICVAGCINNGLGLGTYVSLRADAAAGYHPVAFAVSGGVGRDFGLIDLPAELHDRLRPEMPQWGGPTGLAGGVQLGSLVAHYGHGTLLVPGVAAFVTRTPLDQGRLAVLSSNSGASFQAVGHVTGGDSGSGASLAQPGADLAHGTEALGVVTHSIVVVGAPLLSGTRMTQGLELASGHLGIALELVPAGDPLPTTGRDPIAAPTFAVNVTDPVPGAAIDKGSKRVTVRGTAAASGGLPAGSTVQLAVDDPEFGVQSRVPVSGNATWSGVWDLAGVPAGQHTLRARLVDAEGTVLAQENVTVTLTKAGASPSPSPSPAPRPGGGSGSAATGTATQDAGGAPRDDGFGLASKPAPAAPAAIALAALGFALALRRRR